MRVIDEQQSGASIELPRGEVLAIRLKENAATGYRWSVDAADGLQLQEDSSHAGAGNAPGAAGFHEFRFDAAQPGTHDVRLKHWRDWQGEGSVIGRFQVTVRVG
jgi:inhibitor of cysteine peptidase